MKINKKILTYATLVLVITGLYFYYYAGSNSIQYKAVKISRKELNYNVDLDYLVSEMRLLGSQLTNETVLVSDTIDECNYLKNLFAESFTSSEQYKIDFILMIHPDSLGIDPNPVMQSATVRSQENILRIMYKNKYDLVAIEGSVIGGFSPEQQARELYARMKYNPDTALVESLNKAGMGQSSYEEIRPYLLSVIETQGHHNWQFEIEKKINSQFLSAESLQFSTLMFKFLSGRINTNNRERLINTIQKLRSAYVVATTIKGLKNAPSKRAVIVFGALHYNDFDAIASATGIKSTIYNATGFKFKG